MCRDERRLSESNNRAATHHFTRKTVYREHTEREKGRCDAAIHHSETKNLCREHGEGLGEGQPCSDTLFLTEKHVSRTGIRDGGCGSCSDTPFREQKPVSRAWGGREKTNRGHTAQRPTASYDQHTTALYHYTTKALPQKRRKSFIGLSANRLS